MESYIMSWTWKITKSKIGFKVEKGLESNGGEPVPDMPGWFTMPGFIVYEISTFNTHRQALSFVQQKKHKDDSIIDLTEINNK